MRTQLKIRLQATAPVAKWKDTDTSKFKKYTISNLYCPEPIEITIIQITRVTIKQSHHINVIFIFKNNIYFYKYYAVNSKKHKYGLGLIKDKDDKAFYDPALNNTTEQIGVHSAILDILNTNK